MLKIEFHVPHREEMKSSALWAYPYREDCPDAWDNTVKYWVQHGIDARRQHNKPDVLFVEASHFEERGDWPDINTIILTCKDAIQYRNGHTTKLMNSKNTKYSFVRGHIFKNDIYYSNCIDPRGEEYTKRFWGTKNPQPRQLNTERLFLGHNFFWDKFHGYYQQPNIPWQKKDIDLMFCGTVDNTAAHARGYHRRQMAEYIKSLKNLDTVISYQNDLTLEEHWNLLSRTKVALCPWGFAEICGRDFQAMMNGCTIVKPEMHWVETWPNEPYQKGVVWCKKDWSNLKEKVDLALSSFDNTLEFRKRKAKRLSELRENQDVLSERMLQVFKQILGDM